MAVRVADKIKQLNDGSFKLLDYEDIDHKPFESLDPNTLDVDDNGMLSVIGGGGSGTSSYSDLANKPSINDIELSGNKSLSDLSLYSKTETDDLLDSKIDDIDIVTSFGASPSDSKIPSEKLVKDSLDSKTEIDNSSTTSTTKTWSASWLQSHVDKTSRLNNPSKQISSGTDLNTLTTLCEMYASKSASSTLLHCPVKSIDFKLTIKKPYDLYDIIQVLETVTDTYTRYYKSSTWSDWVKVLNEGDIVTSFNTALSDTKIPSEKLVKDNLDSKQDLIPTYTLTEYEAIKDDIPEGTLFNISDDETKVTNAGTNKYSTNEIICGEWIDGKPLYRKVISIPLGNTGTKATAYVIGHGSSTLRIQSCITTISDDNHTDGYYFSSSYWTLNNSAYVDGNGGTKITANGQIVITCSDDWRGYTATCIVEYTKTTD